MNTVPYSSAQNFFYGAHVHPRALMVLCVTVFLLTGMPRLSIKLGPIPVYAIDLLAASALYYATRVKTTHRLRNPFAGYLIAIALFALIGEIGAVLYSGDIIRPAYAFTRTILSLSLAYSTSRIIQSREDILALTKAVILGIGLTSALMILSSLPFTRAIVGATVFSLPLLEPASTAAAKFIQSPEVATRGRSLIGVSILSGAFINAFWPVIALYYRLPTTRGRWKGLTLICCLIAPFGVVLSYSRGAILGLFLVVAGVLAFGSSRSRKGIIVAFLGAVAIFTWVGWDSELFYFERVSERTQAMINDPYADEREWERARAYSQPFEHLSSNPLFLFMGEGTSIGKTGVVSQQTGKATHAAFAQAYYSYGMIAAVLYVLMILSIARHLVRQVLRTRTSHSVYGLYYQSLFAGFLGLLSWFAFGHAVISTPRGAMLLFLFIGLILSLRNVEASELTAIYREPKA